MRISRDREATRALFFFSSRRRHTRWNCDWSSDVCSSDLDLRVLGNRNFAVGTSLMIIMGIVLYGTIAMLPLFLQTLMGYRSEERRVGKDGRSRWWPNR